MTVIKAMMEELAFIAAQMGSLQARKERLESQIMKLSEAKAKKEYVTPSIEVKVELPAPPTEIIVDMEDILQKQRDAEEALYTSKILVNRNHTEWCDGAVDSINIHLKQTPADDKHPYPYTLWKEKIFEIDAYDITNKYIGTSPQFHIDALGVEILRYLRTRKGFGKYEPKTYNPIGCTLYCNEK